VRAEPGVPNSGSPAAAPPGQSSKPPEVLAGPGPRARPEPGPGPTWARAWPDPARTDLARLGPGWGPGRPAGRPG